MPDILFEDVYRQYATPIFRFCVAQLRNHAIAEDVASTIFVSAYKSYRETPPEPARIRAWLYRIARNAIIDHVRREHRWARLFAQLGRQERTLSVEEVAEYRQEVRDVLDGLSKLRLRDRQLAALRLVGQLDATEIGQVMGLNEDAARIATARAVEKLRASVERTL